MNKEKELSEALVGLHVDNLANMNPVRDKISDEKSFVHDIEGVTSSSLPSPFSLCGGSGSFVLRLPQLASNAARATSRVEHYAKIEYGNIIRSNRNQEGSLKYLRSMLHPKLTLIDSSRKDLKRKSSNCFLTLSVRIAYCALFGLAPRVSLEVLVPSPHFYATQTLVAHCPYRRRLGGTLHGNNSTLSSSHLHP